MAAGAVILAAGAATRMGRLKQLLPYKGGTLLAHAITQAQRAGFTPVVVVVGAQSEEIIKVVERTEAAWVLNEKWESGMGSSVTAGVGRMLEMVPDIAAIAMLLADQPLVTGEALAGMYEELEQGNASIIAAGYGETVGVPAIFRKAVFERLKSLAADAGARTLLRDGETAVRRYQLPEAAIDVDTPEDFAELA